MIGFARKAVLVGFGSAVLTVGLLASPISTRAATGFTLANVGAFGGEPTIASDSNGVLYDTTPSGGTILYRGVSPYGTGNWVKTDTADPSSGDDCVTTDQANAVYECNLAGSTSTAPLQADVWKSTNMGDNPWVEGQNQAGVTLGNGEVCGGSCSAAGVDRQWTTAWIPSGSDTNTARVVLMYHDFYGPSQIWVNISTDGGQTFAASKPVLENPAATQAGVTGSATGLFYQECNTVPSGIQTVKSGKYKGRIYVSWVAADSVQNASGCNISMAESFHDLWVAWSDDGGSTWTTQLAFDGLPGHDGSTPFAAFTIDDQGNPYIAFAMNLNAVANGSGVQSLCPAETGATLQADTSCQYNMYVVWGQPDANGDVVFDGGGGLIPNSAAQPYLVNNPTSEPGTHWFPAIAAGDPGQVDVAYLRTPTIEPTDAFGKVVPRACAGAGNGTPPPPPTYPPACQWDLFAGQSLNLTSPPGSATWTTEDLTTPTPMHIGDICNLGIACDPLSNDRNLLDFNSEALDPQGCAHIAYADDNTVNMLRVANQTPGAGCLTLTSATEGAVPEAPWVALFVPAALAATWLGRRSRRRRTRTAI